MQLKCAILKYIQVNFIENCLKTLIFILICKRRFYMLEKIAMWGGVSGIVIALFAIVILYLTRGNIIDLLDRDVVMYDKNYEMKKDAFEQAFNCLDAVSQSGVEIKNNAQYAQRAREAYNGLLCTVTSAKIYQEFYRLALDTTTAGYSTEDIEKFKISCRVELIGKHRNKKEAFKGATSGALGDNGILGAQTQMPIQRPQARPTQAPVQPRPQRGPARPAQSPASAEDEE